MPENVIHQSLLADQRVRSIITDVQQRVNDCIPVEDQLWVQFESGHSTAISLHPSLRHDYLNTIGLELVEANGRIRELAFVSLCWTIKLRTPTWDKSYPIPIRLPTVQHLIVFSGRNARKTCFVKALQPVRSIQADTIDWEAVQIYKSNAAIRDLYRHYVEHVYDGAHLADAYHKKLED